MMRWSSVRAGKVCVYYSAGAEASGDSRKTCSPDVLINKRLAQVAL